MNISATRCGILVATIVVGKQIKSEERKKWTSEFLKDVLSDNTFPIYAIIDEQAEAYIDGKKFIGGKSEILGKDK